MQPVLIVGETDSYSASGGLTELKSVDHPPSETCEGSYGPDEVAVHSMPLRALLERPGKAFAASFRKNDRYSDR